MQDHDRQRQPEGEPVVWSAAQNRGQAGQRGQRRQGGRQRRRQVERGRQEFAGYPKE